MKTTEAPIVSRWCTVYSDIVYNDTIGETKTAELIVCFVDPKWPSNVQHVG